MTHPLRVHQEQQAMAAPLGVHQEQQAMAHYQTTAELILRGMRLPRTGMQPLLTRAQTVTTMSQLRR